MVHFWFIFPERRIKVPNSCELGPLAGDVYDNGNDINTDDCVSCLLAHCGDGVTWKGQEQCDDGNASQSDVCLGTCEFAACGDGEVLAGVEACDDGDDDETDECTSACELAVCGDGLVWAGQEECDDGNASNGDPCLNTCVANVCGDGFVDATAEGCDDANGDNNDGCSNACKQGAVSLGVSVFASNCAVREGGVRCWGENTGGHLGYGSTANFGDEPGDLPLSEIKAGPPGALVIKVGSGVFNTCAVFDTGEARCWGAGVGLGLGMASPNLGDDPDELPAPAVPLGGAAVDVGVGEFFACALMDTGGVRCWGKSAEGQTGYPFNPWIGDDETPASMGDVSLGAKATQISVARFHTCALLVGGSVRCWGRNASGRLGIKSTAPLGDNELPTAVPPVDLGGTAIQVAAGGIHTCALLDTGKMRCWGEGSAGSLGYKNINNIGDNEAPAAAGDVKMLEPLDMVKKVAVGDAHTCALLATGAVRCWGIGPSGELGYGPPSKLGDDPADVSPLVDVGGQVRDLVLGFGLSCALLDGGAVRCWGSNIRGQLGTGGTNNVGDDPGEMPPKDALIFPNP